MKKLAGFLFAVCVALPLAVQAQPLPRTILVPLSFDTEDPMYTLAHQSAETVLNYQGLKVEYIAPEGPYPQLDKRPDVRGVLSWLDAGARLQDVAAYWQFMASAAKAGKKVVIMGELFPIGANNAETTTEQANSALNQLGLHTDGNWEPNTYALKRLDKHQGYETPMPVPVPPLFHVRPIDSVTPYFAFEQQEGEGAYILGAALSPQGGYIAEGLAMINDGGENEERRWVINPFEFFEKAFGSASLPKPDVTTLLGTRIYFSHIDGDGWRSVTQLEKYNGTLTTNADVLYHDVLMQTPDLPTAVAPIAAEVDTAWLGTPETQHSVTEIFALPNVEPSSHTYSHPFSWDFYNPKNFNPSQEEKFARKYPPCAKGRHSQGYNAEAHQHSGETSGTGELDEYDLPRAFGCAPFSAQKETVDSVKVLSAYVPEGKKIELMQWSGNTRPFEDVLATTEKAGLVHMNGGLTRFDNRFASVAHVTPIGIQKGQYWQVYAPMSNENTYTNLWQGPYHGFRYLVQTLQNTETPYRLKPLNVYYHTYSAEKDASYKSLMMVFDYVRQQQIIPIKASNYARIAQGFYNTKVEPQGAKWVVKNRGALQTIRFSKATFKRVDFANSTGVIGQRHFAGSLYVALDPQVAEPVIALMPHKRIDLNPEAPQPYVVNSRWPVTAFKVNAHAISVEAKGYGEGPLTLRMPSPAPVTVRMTQQGSTKTLTLNPAGADNLVRIPLTQPHAQVGTKMEVVW